MKNLIFIITLSICLFACNSADPNKNDLPTTTASDEVVKDGVFFHVSSGIEKPKKVLMALTLAAKFAESHDVALFFDLEGVKLLTQNAEELASENYMSTNEALKALTEQGVLIMACPMCVKEAGLTEADLIEGVIIAEKEKFFSFTKGRIVSLDY